MKESIESIVDALPEHRGETVSKTSRRHKLLTKKLMGIPLVYFLAVGVVSASLIAGVLWQTHVLEISGIITVNGSTQEAKVFYDGLLLEGESTTITTMDVSELDPGTTQTFTHVFSNQDGEDYTVSVQLPPDLEYVNEQDIWYGFAFHVYEHGTTNEVQQFDLTPMTDVTLDYVYQVDELFRDPGEPFNFLLTYTIELDGTPENGFIQPIGGETWDEQTVHSITYSVPEDTTQISIYFHPEVGSPSVIVESIPPTGTYAWTIFAVTSDITGHLYLVAENGGTPYNYESGQITVRNI